MAPSKTRGWLLASLPLMLALACSGQSLRDPDGDEVFQKSRAFKHIGATADKLDVSAGDLEDWRFFVPDRAGKMEMRVAVGMLEESTIVGFVTVLTEFERVIERPFPVGTGVLKVPFEVEANKKYLVRFKATSGKGRYAVEVGLPEDACSACDKNTQDCVDEKCVDKPCGGTCGENETCDKSSNRCVKTGKPKPEDKCAGVNCPSGHFCVRQTGRCAKEHEKEAKCTPTQIEKNGECVEKPSDLVCGVIDVRESATGSVLTLNCGDNKKITKGTTGSIRGVKGGTFTVTDVYPSRSKATCKLPPGKFPPSPVGVIKQ